jgi:LPXTG-site transpeptidase (sortase) family protein
VLVVAIAAVLIVVATSGGGGNGGGQQAVSPTRAPASSGGLATDAIPTVEATIDLNRPTSVAAENLTAVGASDKVVISRLGINQALAYHKVGLDGVMPDPTTPDEVAYYDFSAWPGLGGAPGKGGNTVISGHVDSGTKACKNGTVPPPCTAVFWELRNLRIGDEIEMQIAGTTYKYRVQSNEPVSAKDDRWGQIVSSTQQESLTIITCGGQFNPATREYDLRTVVTAMRV